MEYRYTENELRNAIENSFSIAETCRKLGIVPLGGNYQTIKRLIKKYEIDTSHFTGQGWNKGLVFKPMKITSIEDILIEDSTYYSSCKLKNRLFNEGFKEKKCEICGNTMWMDKKIPLELHHKNGISTDNRIENLQILCNNCHAQTENFRKGKSSLNKIRKEKYDNVMSDFKNGLINIGNPKNKQKVKLTVSDKPKRCCEICGKELKYDQKLYCSVECYQNGRKGNRPDVFELIKKFKELKNFVQVGKFYNVSDNAIRKWCIFYGILDKINSKSY